MKKKRLLQSFNIIWLYSKKWLIISIIFRIFNGLVPLATLWITKELINDVTLIVQGDKVNLMRILILILLQLSLAILKSIVLNIQKNMDNATELKLDYYLGKKIINKAISVPLAYYDYPEFFNHHDRVSGSFGNRLLSPIINVFDIFQGIISIFSFIVFLFFIHWSLVIISLLSAIPILLIQIKYGQKKYWLMRYQTPSAREANYIQNLLNERQSAKEIRIFQLGNYLLERWGKIYLSNSTKMLILLQKQNTAKIWLDLCTAFLYSSSLIIMIWLAINKKIGVGEFVTIGQAVQGTQSLINQIAISLAKIHEEHLYIDDLLNFLEFEVPYISNYDNQNKIHLFPNTLKKGIIFENVYFSYPNSNKNILNNINFTIKPGEKIAIVGENGSGKTTLVKCLMGLYTVTNGQIFFDEKNIDEIKVEDLYKNITVIFQDYIKYSLTVKDNIVFGDIANYNDEIKLKVASEKSGVDDFVKLFKEGYDTKLGKILAEGEDLSGGQWQKIALARALFRDSQIVILDEPTAALDPKTELEVFSQFKNLAKNKTAIFISHRMAAARMADRIFVMKNGRLIEIGSHNELMNLGNEYYNMYQMQARWYA